MMRNKILILIIVLGMVILASGCIETPKNKEMNVSENKETETETPENTNEIPPLKIPEFVSVEEVITKCINECKSRKDTGDFSKGPCLSNEIVPDWVCDIAHNPRQDVDNLPENQCSAFREGKAHHFVELDLNCSIIKVH